MPLAAGAVLGHGEDGGFTHAAASAHEHLGGGFGEDGDDAFDLGGAVGEVVAGDAAVDAEGVEVGHGGG